MNWLRRLFGRAPVLILNVSDFGPLLKWEQVVQMTAGCAQSEHFRLMMQLAEFQRQLCQRAVQDKSNTLHGQTQFEAGGAAAMADLMLMLTTLEAGKDQYPDLKQWFGGQSLPKQ